MKHFRPHLPKTEQVAQNLYMNTAQGRVSVQQEDIIYLEAKENYTVFHTVNNRYITSFHLKFFGEVLKENPDFLRINRSYIVNLNFFEGLKWSSDVKEMKLQNGTHLVISRRRARKLKEVLLDKANM